MNAYEGYLIGTGSSDFEFSLQTVCHVALEPPGEPIELSMGDWIVFRNLTGREVIGARLVDGKRFFITHVRDVSAALGLASPPT